MSTIQADFDRLAALDAEGWTQINHYHNFLLRHVRPDCQNALEVGCGTGAFARRLAERAQHVVALDLSPEMIRVARSAEFPNIEFHVADAISWDFPAAHFDCIATIATLHHLPLREMILKTEGCAEARRRADCPRSLRARTKPVYSRRPARYFPEPGRHGCECQPETDPQRPLEAAA